MKKFVTPFRVGLLVLAAGAFFFTFVMLVKKGGLDDDEAIHVYAYFRDASGLGTKSRVQIAGIPVGEVKDVVLEGTRAKVFLLIRREVDLREDAVLSKRSESLLGDYLLDLNPGTDEAQPMPDNGQIRRVIDTQGMEAAFQSLAQITADIQQVTKALRDVLGGEKGQGSLERIVDNLVRLSDRMDQTVGASAEKLDAILGNFEGVSADVRKITQGNESNVNRIVGNIEYITRDVREVLTTVKKIIGTGEGDLKESVASLKSTLNKLDNSLANIESITGKVASGEGVASSLPTDERLGQRLTETVEGVADLVNRVTDLNVEVGLRSEYLLTQGRARNAVALRIVPKPDKYYLFELVDDPRGVVETQVVQNNPPGSGEPVTQVQRITREAFKVSAQFAKRYYFTTLRFGLIESTGGVGADLHFLDDSLMVRTDVFNLSAEELRYPRVRTSVRAHAFNHIFVTGGVDDILNAPRRDLVTNRLIAGRDFFLGGGIFFTDDDLAAILNVVPTPSF